MLEDGIGYIMGSTNTLGVGPAELAPVSQQVPPSGGVGCRAAVPAARVMEQHDGSLKATGQTRVGNTRILYNTWSNGVYWMSSHCLGYRRMDT